MKERLIKELTDFLVKKNKNLDVNLFCNAHELAEEFGNTFLPENKKMNNYEQIERLPNDETQSQPSRLGAVICWVAFDWNKIKTRPTEYGKYLICRKDGKIHWETWNGSGWAYNHNDIRYWAVIVPPCS